LIPIAQTPTRLRVTLFVPPSPIGHVRSSSQVALNRLRLILHLVQHDVDAGAIRLGFPHHVVLNRRASQAVSKHLARFSAGRIFLFR